MPGMAGNLVALNFGLVGVANLTRAVLNNGHSLRLFCNNIQPTPGMSELDFSEISFNGYNRKNLNGLWAVPLKIRDGEYLLRTGALSWTCNAASDQIVYGWYIVGDNNAKYAARLPDPIELGPMTSFSVAVQLSVSSLWLM